METMRFLLKNCRASFKPLSELGLTKRTIDKRTKARDAAVERAKV